MEDSVLLNTSPFGSNALSSFGVDQNNELYACKLTSPGAIYRFTSSVTGIEQTGIEAEGYRLEQNYPNPFNPATSISFTIAKANFVTLKVYDVLGKEEQTLVNGNKIAGEYKVTWDASNFPSGVYFYKLTVNNQSIEKKMVLIK